MLFSEPKIPQFNGEEWLSILNAVSVLFSEPKIPQWAKASARWSARSSFSALQRAENSSICAGHRATPAASPRFSALQRAENSSIGADGSKYYDGAAWFQCSSASRKFLNARSRRRCVRTLTRFSALQRAENSSIFCVSKRAGSVLSFSALQRAENSSILGYNIANALLPEVSVLFSEPKIPQLISGAVLVVA